MLEGVTPGAPPLALVDAAISKLVIPAGQDSGDSKLEMPPANRVKVEAAEHEGQVGGWNLGRAVYILLYVGSERCLGGKGAGQPGSVAVSDSVTSPLQPSCYVCGPALQAYIYFAFPSETLTRSGYNIRRKNLGVVAARGGRAYVLGASARSDQASPEKLAVFSEVVQSFRLR